MRRLLLVLFATVIVAFSLRTVHEAQTDNQMLKLREIKLKNTHLELQNLELDYQRLQADKATTEQQKEAEIKRLQEREAQLEKDLQARRLLKAQESKVYAAEEVRPLTAPLRASESYPTPSGAKGLIYSHESGNRLTAINKSSGACGLGQSWPCSKLAKACPNWRTDYACQDKWFTNYCMNRYGSWEAARNFWLKNNYW